MRKLTIGFICALLFFVLGAASLAQDAPPIEDDEADGATLESVTADPASFYGQQVTLQGVVAEFINARAFIFGEGAILDNDQVIVINNSPQEFDLRLTLDRRVQITGTALPAVQDNGFEQLQNAGMIHPVMMSGQPTGTDNTMNNTTPMPEATTEADMAATPMAEGTTEADMAATPMAEGTTEADMTDDDDTVQATLEPTPVSESGTTTTTPGTTTSPDMTTMGAPIDLTVMITTLMDRYPDYVIIEITSMDQIVFIEEPEG